MFTINFVLTLLASVTSVACMVPLFRAYCAADCGFYSGARCALYAERVRYTYLLRILGFALILGAIVDKNLHRGTRRDITKPS